MFQDGVELNWLPPTEPNGEVHYVIEYKREDSGNWTSANTTSDSTHYNLTGLHSGTNYTIRVVAVNSAGRTESTPINATLTSESDDSLVSTSADLTGVVAGAVVACVIILALLIAGIVTVAVLRRRMRRRSSPQKKEEADIKREKDSADRASISKEWEAKQQLHSTLPGQHADEQHYETTDNIGLDWYGNAVRFSAEELYDDVQTPPKAGNEHDYTSTKLAGTNGEPGLEYVVIDHSRSKNERAAPSVDDHRVVYATVDGSKTLSGPDMKADATHYSAPTPSARPN